MPITTWTSKQDCNFWEWPEQPDGDYRTEWPDDPDDNLRA